MMEIKRGQRVKYVPHVGHCHDMVKDGDTRVPAFKFLHDDPQHPRNGQAVDVHELVEAKPKIVPDMAGKPSLQLGERGHKLKVGDPHCHWDAVVSGVWPDGTVSIHFTHPDPGQGTRDYENIKVVDPDLPNKPLHCCYPVKEEAK